MSGKQLIFMVPFIATSLVAAFFLGAANADPCDTGVTSIIQGFAARRDAGDYTVLSRYLTTPFEVAFRDTISESYLEHIANPDVTWRDSRLQGSTSSAAGCTAEIRSTRVTDGASTAINETYTLVQTDRGWRIDRWDWQPAP